MSTVQINGHELEAEPVHLEPGDTLVLYAPEDAPAEVLRAALPELKRLHPSNPVLVVQGSRWGAHGLGPLERVADAIHAALERDRTAGLPNQGGPLHSFDRADLAALERLVRAMAKAAL